MAWGVPGRGVRSLRALPQPASRRRREWLVSSGCDSARSDRDAEEKQGHRRQESSRGLRGLWGRGRGARPTAGRLSCPRAYKPLLGDCLWSHLRAVLGARKFCQDGTRAVCPAPTSPGSPPCEASRRHHSQGPTLKRRDDLPRGFSSTVDFALVLCGTPCGARPSRCPGQFRAPSWALTPTAPSGVPLCWGAWDVSS